MPGQRAPDARGLRRGATAAPLRLFELLSGPDLVLFLYADAADPLASFEALAAAAQVRAYAVLAPGVDGDRLAGVPVIEDRDGQFAAAYGASGDCAYLIRPDGSLAYRAAPVDAGRLAAHLRTIVTG